MGSNDFFITDARMLIAAIERDPAKLRALVCAISACRIVRTAEVVRSDLGADSAIRCADAVVATWLSKSKK